MKIENAVKNLYTIRILKNEAISKEKEYRGVIMNYFEKTFNNTIQAGNIIARILPEEKLVLDKEKLIEKLSRVLEKKDVEDIIKKSTKKETNYRVLVDKIKK